MQCAISVTYKCRHDIFFLCTGLVYAYVYLAGHIGCNSNTVGAFRALKQGYILWALGRLE